MSIRSVWTPGHLAIIRAAARDPAVERIFVNAAIKKAFAATRPAIARG